MVVDIKKEIFLTLKDLLKTLTKENIDFLVEKPENENFGDYSSNAALVASKILKKNPFDLALELVRKINISKLPEIAKIDVVKPGFINFHLSEKYLVAQLGKTPLRQGFAGRKIMVEFTDPNPFKEFHIGHLYSNTVGESVSRLLEAMGANLKRANYQGDVGMHIAKSLYGIFQISNFKSQISNLDNKSKKERAEFLGQCYAVGAKAYEEDDVKKREIEELNKKIYAKDEAVMAYYEKGRQWSLEYFETVYKRLGTKFDFYYFESEVGINGLKLVKEYLAKGIFEESQGAVIFPGKKYNLHDRVFINSLGLPTYEAKELGLAFKKYSDFEFDQSIVITGNEIIGYFKVLIAALGKINPELAAKTKHLTHGMVRLPTGKMSSRTGNIITGEWLLDEAKKLLKSKFSEMTEEVLEQVTVGAVKYALLKSSLGHDIEFDFEESINIQGNSGPYLQYAYVRTQSVLNKCHPELVSGSSVGRQKVGGKNEMLNSSKRTFLSGGGAVQHDTMQPEELSLLRTLNRFPEVVTMAAEKFAPNLLCNYLFDLSQKFNLLYQKHKIIDSDQEDFRLKLTQGVGQIIKTGLNLLGIQAPEKM
jgi:arginyl-tRNA synthetase